VKRTTDWFEADFTMLQGGKPAPLECKPAKFMPSGRVVDAGPLIERAFDLFALNNPLSPAQLGLRSHAVMDSIRSVVIDVLSSMDPSVRSTLPPAADQAKIRQLQAKVPQRWIALSIEIEIIALNDCGSHRRRTTAMPTSCS
jgi:hypothetical protein